MAEQMVVDASKLQEMIAREVDKTLNSRFRKAGEIRKLPASAEMRNEIRPEIATKAQVRRVIGLLIVALILVIIMTTKFLFFYP